MKKENDCIIEVVRNGKKAFYKNIIINEVNLVQEEEKAFRLPEGKAVKVADLLGVKLPNATITVMQLENEGGN